MNLIFDFRPEIFVESKNPQFEDAQIFWPTNYIATYMNSVVAKWQKMEGF